MSRLTLVISWVNFFLRGIICAFQYSYIFSLYSKPHVCCKASVSVLRTLRLVNVQKRNLGSFLFSSKNLETECGSLYGDRLIYYCKIWSPVYFESLGKKQKAIANLTCVSPASKLFVSFILWQLSRNLWLTKIDLRREWWMVLNFLLLLWDLKFLPNPY